MQFTRSHPRAPSVSLFLSGVLYRAKYTDTLKNFFTVHENFNRLPLLRVKTRLIYRVWRMVSLLSFVAFTWLVSKRRPCERNNFREAE